jgi:hypothetical protein
VSDDARRHHYVPACYLKQFAIPQDRYEGRLYVYDRARGKPWPSSPDKSAHARDFYRVDVDGEHPNLAENTYESLETRFAPVLADVCERGVLPKDDTAMANLLAFVASQAVRTPRLRGVLERFYNDTMMLTMRTLAKNKRAFVRALRDQNPDITDTDAEELFATQQEFVNSKGARVSMDQTTVVRDSLGLTNPVLDALAERFWILGVAPNDTAFVTTDDPVHLQPAGAAPPSHPLWSPAFGDRHTTVLVTLNPRLLLMGLPYEFEARARVRLSRAEVAATNTDLALAAHRFVFSTRPTFAQVGTDGRVIEGPAEMLRLTDEPSERAASTAFSAAGG